MEPATLVAAAAGTAAAAYLNGKYQVGKDLKLIWALRKTERQGETAAVEKKQSYFYVIEAAANKFPTARALWSRNGSCTFAEFYRTSMQYANWFLSIGVKPQDAIALYSINSTDFFTLSFAMWAVGSYPALINYNLAGESLVHCLKVAKSKILLVEDESDLLSRIKDTEADLKKLGIKVIVLKPQLRTEIATKFPDTRPPDRLRNEAVRFSPAMLIYTSGTTGLPKAFGLPMQRLYIESQRFGWYPEVRNPDHPEGQDTWYACMPLYHGTGYITSMYALANGLTVAIGRKFSTSQFWKDVHDCQATAFCYVGETARYLLAAPPSALDRTHKVRLMYGNGMRPDVWDKFQARFNVPEVFEFFNSTEGMLATSVWSRSGYASKTVGHHGGLLRLLTHRRFIPVALDPDTNDMYRDPKTGFAKRVPYEQGGEIIVKVESKGEWAGYHNNKEATNKKFAYDVFQKGDIYYRPGDALRRDADGCWFFMDRLGDTFRWKGENVSTAEVQDVLGHFPGVAEANVYGVQVPGSDGRAGCAAIVLEQGDDKNSGAVPAANFNWSGLTQFLREKLPRYAVPLFIRVIDAGVAADGDAASDSGEGSGKAAQAMGTHNNKQNKVLLREEGANPRLIGTRVPHTNTGGRSDRLYWLRPDMSGYQPFGQSDWDAIAAGRTKL